MKRRDFLKTTGYGSIGLILPSLVVGTERKNTRNPNSAEGVLIEAPMFEDKGGWVIDPQFIDVMGAPYLLAHGMGKPVANARTKVTFPAPGDYRLWVRTKNWCPGDWEAPGRFRVIIDGTPLKTIFGTETGWGWQKGDRVAIDRTDTVVELQDLTGFEGRCDALFFTPDESFTPPNDREVMRRWLNKLNNIPEVPASAGEFDVVIVGGGIAGCAAAIAADKHGLKVALIQDLPVYGGNASGEVRVHTIGSYGLGEKELKPICSSQGWVNASPKALADDERRMNTMNGLNNVTHFLGWRVFAAEKAGNRITSVNALQATSGKRCRFIAPIFIDCTGDGWLGYYAGAEFRYGREACGEFGEAWEKHGDLWSPQSADRWTMGLTILFTTCKEPVPSDFPAVPWAEPVAKDHQAIGNVWHWEYAAETLSQIDDAETIRDHLFRAIYGSFANAKKNDANRHHRLDWVGFICGKRESRRLMGDYIFSQIDALKGTYHDDTVAQGEREIDIHYQRNHHDWCKLDFLSNALYRKEAPVYYMPFRSLYSKNIENLMMAGRCFSCSHIGLGGPRVMKNCGQMGLAVGSAAALCRKHKTTPRGIYQNHVRELKCLMGYGDAPPIWDNHNIKDE